MNHTLEMAAKAQFGQVNEFDPQVDDWTHYVERLDYYFVANDITNAEKKRAVLLSVVGATTYRLLRNLIAPAKPDEKTYKELVDAVKGHYCPKPSETVQRYNLYFGGEDEFWKRMKRLFHSGGMSPQECGSQQSPCRRMLPSYAPS